MIASVYRNRLEIGMNMEADPTVQYGINGTRGEWWVNITVADYRGVNSPYNTYLINGLPPGPIANPSLSAIRGAAYPAQTDFIFFRAKCDGSNYHNFAVAFDEHLANGC
ncbi:MAG: endolytic transglycosylase MltG [Chloroflexota bacterium]